MIYITDSNRNIKIQRHDTNVYEQYTLILLNILTNTEYAVESLVGIRQKYYYNITIPLSTVISMPEGEYRFFLKSGQSLIQQGLMWRERDEETDVYYTTTVVDVVYEGEEVTEDEFAILLDDGSYLCADNNEIILHL